MIELEKMHTSTTENLCNINVHHMIEISLVLQSAHLIPNGQDRVVFYVNNYII